MQDLLVLNSTREFATLVVTRCATAYAKPKWAGGHRNVEQLRKCMREAGVGFSEEPAAAWAKPANKPSCMDCWTDNVACDAVACVSNFDCIRRFFYPAGTSFSGCIKCDEVNCGADFIRCAGANRRSSGVSSDIARPSQQVCPVGYWSVPPPPPPPLRE
ncbi:hypothetical protein EMIHUDRAFT_424486 [Emiliania huxleyi CCMP1516]|uniref:Uncharacterized protein n=2 Tax=Emiliania huxleyi TaxID=2903 RepID=A0A0D3JJS6_EMIH1|nr:hypothetical protein EMIHUDRAFT_424486 [Emiliania huxleyi CCMP1516]EOD23761.1 hypothetical protein EMIHUDRAFT_424486 [Emiliania huxleyi CCMP1516]|eukprot:XP_005776190.1 hypothetical protein EMIHUDRAFT_424486 [Emiliania huxleyi CCMP1516]